MTMIPCATIPRCMKLWQAFSLRFTASLYCALLRCRPWLFPLLPTGVMSLIRKWYATEPATLAATLKPTSILKRAEHSSTAAGGSSSGPVVMNMDRASFPFPDSGHLTSTDRAMRPDGRYSRRSALNLTCVSFPYRRQSTSVKAKPTASTRAPTWVTGSGSGG